MAFKGLRRLAGGGLLLLELRGVRRELNRVADAVERLAASFEEQNSHAYPRHVEPPVSGHPEAPVVEVTYADDAHTQHLMQIEMGLAAATGRMPTEDEVLAEYERQTSAPGWTPSP